MTFYIILALSAFLISLLGTRLTILALRNRVMFTGMPTLRNAQIPAPRSGGIAIVISLVICLLVAEINYGIVLALLLLVAISLMNDLVEVPLFIRILVRIIAIGITLTIMPPFFSDIVPLWLERVLIGIMWLWFMHVFVLSDEIDGLCVTEMCCISAGLCLLTVINGGFPSPLSAYSLIIAAAGCGFLWWNWYPARIYLSEVGSAPISYLIGYLLLLSLASGYVFPVLILPAYYFSEAVIIVLRKIFCRKQPASTLVYYYHRAIQNGRTQKSVVRYIFGIHLLLILLATLSVLDKDIAIFHLAMAYMTVFMLLGFFAHTDSDPLHESS